MKKELRLGESVSDGAGGHTKGRRVQTCLGPGWWPQCSFPTLLLPPESCDTCVGHWGNVLEVSWQGRGAVPQKDSQGEDKLRGITSNSEEAEVEWSCEDLQDLLKLTAKTDIPFILEDKNAKVGNQEIPGVTGKFGLGVQNEAGQRLIEFCQENSLVIANTLFQQPKRQLYTWTSPDGQYRNQTDCILCRQRWRRSIQSAKTRPGANCGSDHKFLIAKFRLKLKKVGKTTRPFRYDLNQIPYNYTVEVRNGFKGLDFIDRVPEELWMEVRNILQEAIIKNIPKEKKCKKVKCCLRRPYK